jgi:hypothetical protein
MSKRKVRDVRPWNVKPGMLIMLGVRPYRAGMARYDGPASDWHEVLDVEKTRGKVTGERCWRITYKSHAHNPPFTGKPESVLRFRDQRVTVEG